jgi:zinc transport system ATP-binding protein
MTYPAIFVSDLDFSYETHLVLQNVNLQVNNNEFIGIIGPNGGGKTTFLKLLMGFLRPQKGKISLFGHSPEEMRLKMGYVPQVHYTDRDFPITVFELILMGALSNKLFYPSSIKIRAEQLLFEMGLQDHKEVPFSSLSGGLAQRALLARALLSDPELLILDEPLANIDPHSSDAILRRLEEMKTKCTILMVSHDLKIIVEKVDRIIAIQTQATSMLPKEVCEHFALGLYHTPLKRS